MERLLPQNLEAECGVLGSIIIDPEAITQVADFLMPEDFYRDAHRILYGAMLELYQRREPADFITTCDELEKRNKLEDIGGAIYITSLVNRVPTSGNVEYYGHIVERTAVSRRLIHAAGQIAAVAYEQGDVEVAMEKAESLIYGIRQRQVTSDFSSDSEILAEYLRELDQAQGEDIVGIPTGFNGLDFLLGGMQNSDLLILAGRPGMGKSGLMLSAAYNAVRDNRSVAIASLEMSKKQLIQRLVSMDARIDLYRMRNRQIHPDQWEAISASMGRLSTGRLWIDDTAGLSIAALRSKLLRFKAKRGLDLVIVDYLQLMKASASKRNDNRVQEIAEITMGLKNLAKELNVPVLALAQLSREVERRSDKTPQLSDLRESGSIENDADVVMFIYRDEYYNPKSERKGQADLIIAKHRNGPTGEVVLQFTPQFTLFANLELEHAKEMGA